MGRRRVGRHISSKDAQSSSSSPPSGCACLVLAILSITVPNRPAPPLARSSPYDVLPAAVAQVAHPPETVVDWWSFTQALLAAEARGPHQPALRNSEQARLRRAEFNRMRVLLLRRRGLLRVRLIVRRSRELPTAAPAA